MEYNPVQTNQRPACEKIAQRLWVCIRSVAFGISPWFARRWRAVFARFAACMYHGECRKIALNCSISRTARLDYPWNLQLGSRSSIGARTWVYALDRISIGCNCCIGDDVRLITGSHDIQSSTFDLVTKPIVIADNVWIATGAYVMPGVTIGEGAVVAAGAVVTKDVDPWTVVGGNPARVLKRREI